MKKISNICAAGLFLLVFAPSISHAGESKDRIRELLEAIDHDDMHYDLLLDEDPFACGRSQRREAFIIESDQSETRRDQIPDWVNSAIWYYIHVPAFRDGDATNNSPDTPKWGMTRSEIWLSQKESAYGGDLDGVREKLPYLKQLGVNALILDGVFEYAKLDRRERLLDSLHVNDAVAVKDSRAALTSETLDKDTWQWSESDKEFREFLREAHREGFRIVVEYPHPASASSGCLGPHMYFWDYSDFIWSMNERWLRKGGEDDGIDGWSVQAVYGYARGIFSGWRGRVKSVNPDCALVGLNQIIRVDDTLNLGVHADALVYNNPAESIAKLFEGSSTSQLKEFIEGSATTRMRIPECVRRRFTGGSYETRFGDCLRSTDAIWNGSTEEDKSETGASAAFNRWQLALLLQTFYFSDYAIQFGEEVGLTQQGLRRARTPMWWEDIEGATVMARRDRLDFLSALNALRAKHSSALHGTTNVLFSDDARRVFAFERKASNDLVVIAVNLSANPEVVELNLGKSERAIAILAPRNIDNAGQGEKHAESGGGSAAFDRTFSKLIQRTDSNGLIKVALEPMTFQVLELN